eukprot:GHVR01016786.1.p1 GENE.GHVR01016786.1~~GHVR01016786.1.p1  ORF type:complete len:283 (+),score=110.85 GHVR01016786.1:43-891(+)
MWGGNDDTGGFGDGGMDGGGFDNGGGGFLSQMDNPPERTRSMTRTVPIFLRNLIDCEKDTPKAHTLRYVKDTSSVTCVCRLYKIQRVSTGIEVLLEDHTARYPAKQFINEDDHFWYEMSKKLERSRNIYVRVYGNSSSKFGQDDACITMHSIKPIEDVEEIAYHTYIVRYLYLQNNYPESLVDVNTKPIPPPFEKRLPHAQQQQTHINNNNMYNNNINTNTLQNTNPNTHTHTHTHTHGNVYPSLDHNSHTHTQHTHTHTSWFKYIIRPPMWTTYNTHTQRI